MSFTFCTHTGNHQIKLLCISIKLPQIITSLATVSMNSPLIVFHVLLKQSFTSRWNSWEKCKQFGSFPTKCQTKLLYPITANDRTQPAIDIPNKTDTPTCANSHKVKAPVSDGNGHLIDVEVWGGF